MLEMLNPKLLIHKIAHTLSDDLNTKLFFWFWFKYLKVSVEIVNFLCKNCTVRGNLCEI